MRADLRAMAWEQVNELLTERSMNMSELLKAIKPVLKDMGDWDCLPAAALVYEALYALKLQRHLKMETRFPEGAFEGLNAPNFYMSL